MFDPFFLLRISTVSTGLAIGLGAATVCAQAPLARVNQDELASFYGRMNVVVGSGARAFGMGGAFLARADDATAASWNPAGLSYLRRSEFSAVGVQNDFSQRIPRVNNLSTPPTSLTTVDRLQGSVADFLGLTYPVRLKGKVGALQLSYQRRFSFSGTRRSEGTVAQVGFLPGGGQVLLNEFTVQGKGGFDSLSLSSGFEVHSLVRLGLTVNRWIKGFSQTVVRPERTIDSNWDISGTNFDFGLLFTPTPKLNLGAVWKTSVVADVTLEKTRTERIGTVVDSTTGIVTPASYQINKAVGDVEIRFPRVYGLGLSYRASNTLTISADFTRTAWSQAAITGFFSLAQNDVDHYPTLPFPAVEEGSNGQSDTGQFRMGAEWVLRFGQSGNDFLPIRAGLFRDGQPVIIRLRNDVNAPISETRLTFSGFTAGLGVSVGGILLDMAYIHETGRVPASRNGDGIRDSVRDVRYNRLFGSMMVRFGPRR